MSTLDKGDKLSASLFGKTRRAVLSLLYSHSDEAFYVRHILRAAAAGHGAVQRELKKLSDAGVINRTLRGKQVYYQANKRCPIFTELKSLIVKTAGSSDLLRNALAPLADRIDVALIYGSLARGEENRSSDIDVLIIGDVSFAEVVENFQQAQETLAREINPAVYPPVEFRAKVAQGHHFLKNILSGDRLFLIGDQHELSRLVKKRLVG